VGQPVDDEHGDVGIHHDLNRHGLELPAQGAAEQNAAMIIQNPALFIHLEGVHDAAHALDAAGDAQEFLAGLGQLGDGFQCRMEMTLQRDRVPMFDFECVRHKKRAIS